MAFSFFIEDGSGQYIGEIVHLGQPVDAEIVTVYDGTNTAVIFEYDDDVSVSGSNTSVTIGASTTATALNLANAIAAARVAGTLDVTAEVDTYFPNRLILRNQDITSGTITSTATGIFVSSFMSTNSYVSLEEADNILQENIHAASWFDLSDGDRERLLVYATKFLDDRTRWNGSKTVETSPLRWPRSDITDRDGRTVGDNEIPEQLKRTVAYIARYNVDQDRTTERSQDALDSLTVDVIELDFKDGYKLPAVPSSLHYMLEGLGSIRGGAHGFAKVIRS
jgi:hypothetical protein